MSNKMERVIFNQELFETECTKFEGLSDKYIADKSNEDLKGKYTAASLDIQFLKELKLYFEKLNSLIKRLNYNPKEERQLLGQISKLRIEIQDKYPPNYMDRYEFFKQEINIKLFNELKKIFETNPELDLRDILGQSSQSIFPATDDLKKKVGSFFSNFLNNMAPDKASRMLEALLTEPPDIIKFKSLYDNEDSADAHAFRDFFNKHNISILAGKNSRNFAISSKDGILFVLKVDNRLNQPKDIVAVLRDTKFSKFLTPVVAERLVSCTTNPGNLTRTLLITEFCEMSDLVHHANNDMESRLTSAIDIYIQMSNALLLMQGVNCAFPDMKNSNWLMRGGTLVIADNKSFTYGTNGTFSVSDPKNIWRKTLCTQFMNPPEMNQKEFSIDKMHSYMLGKNLYQYLSKFSNKELIEDTKKMENLFEHDGSNLQFENSIFKGKLGQKLKVLIEQLVKPEPKDRLSIKMAQTKLKEIQFEAELSQRLIQIKSLGLGEDDLTMDTFIKEKQNAINNASTKEELIEIKTALEVLSLQAPVVDQEDLAIIQNIKKKDTFDGQIARDIWKKIIATPIHERGVIWPTDKDVGDMLGFIKKYDALVEKIYKLNPDQSIIEFLQEIGEKRSSLINKETMDRVEKQLELIILLDKFKSTAVGEDDSKMQDFLNKKLGEIKQATDNNALDNLKSSLNNLYSELDDKSDLKLIKNIIGKFKTLATKWSFFDRIFGLNLELKANSINAALMNIEIDKRTQSELKNSGALKQALNSHVFADWVYRIGGVESMTKFKALKAKYQSESQTPSQNREKLNPDNNSRKLE